MRRVVRRSARGGGARGRGIGRRIRGRGERGSDLGRGRWGRRVNQGDAWRGRHASLGGMVRRGGRVRRRGRARVRVCGRVRIRRRKHVRGRGRFRGRRWGRFRGRFRGWVVQAESEDGGGGAAGDLVAGAPACDRGQALQGGDAAGGVEDAGPGLVQAGDRLDHGRDLGAGQPRGEPGVGEAELVEDVGGAVVGVEPGGEDAGVVLGDGHDRKLRAGGGVDEGLRGDGRDSARAGGVGGRKVGE